MKTKVTCHRCFVSQFLSRALLLTRFRAGLEGFGIISPGPLHARGFHTSRFVRLVTKVSSQCVILPCRGRASKSNKLCLGLRVRCLGARPDKPPRTPRVRPRPPWNQESERKGRWGESGDVMVCLPEEGGGGPRVGPPPEASSPDD